MTHRPPDHRSPASTVPSTGQTSRRAWLTAALSLPVLGSTSACTSMPVPTARSSSEAARALLARTQRAHGGREAFKRLRDVNVSYDGLWFTVVTKLQPVLTDVGRRKTSEERMLFEPAPTLARSPRVIAQQHRGPRGMKQFLQLSAPTPAVWASASGSSNATNAASSSAASPAAPRVSVSYDGQATQAADTIAASHLVANAYQLFLYPAFAVERAVHLETLSDEHLVSRFGSFDVQRLLAVLRPGIGDSAEDRVLLHIDARDGLVRRVRITLEGTASTRGAVVDVDTDAFVDIAGIRWPTRFYEDLVRPFPGLPAHDFWLTGLDVNRGLEPADVNGPTWSAKAASPARGLPARG
jgi:hypothetical protein